MKKFTGTAQSNHNMHSASTIIRHGNQKLWISTDELVNLFKAAHLSIVANQHKRTMSYDKVQNLRYVKGT